MHALARFSRLSLLATLLAISGCATVTPPPAAQPGDKATAATAPESNPVARAAAPGEAPPAAAAAPAPARPNVETPPTVASADALFFKRRSAELDAAEARKLDAHAERLRANPRLIVTLVGHTDDLGSRAYNLAIAEQRTLAVRQRLRELGVPIRQIRRRSFGNEKAGNCSSETCRVKMRRVDLVYPKRRKQASPMAS